MKEEDDTIQHADTIRAALGAHVKTEISTLKNHLITSPFKPQLILLYLFPLLLPLTTSATCSRCFLCGQIWNGWDKALHWLGHENLLCVVLFMSCNMPRAELHMRDLVNKLRANCFIQHGKFLFLGIDRSAWKEVSPQSLSASLGLILKHHLPQRVLPRSAGSQTDQCKTQPRAAVIFPFLV